MLGVVVLLIAGYLLLASGSLAGLIQRIVLMATSDGEATVNVYGGTSNLFRSTSVDSVVVTNDKGLRVAVYGASVTGSVYGYFVGGHVREIAVDSLMIVTPGPSEEPPDSSLAPIFIGTMAGMVTRADRVRLDYGRITDSAGLVLTDSMFLDASITDIDPATIEITSARSFIPLFGMVSASGTLQVDSSRTTLTDVSLRSPPGLLTVSGHLNADSTFSVTAAGSVSTAYLPELPLATSEVLGHFSGSISSPSAVLMLPRGFANYRGLTIGFSADTILADMTGCSVVNFQARTGSASASLSGEAGFSELNWDGIIHLSLQDTDLSSYFPDLPPSSITGTVTASAEGVAGYPGYVDVQAEFSGSRFGDYTLDHLSLNCRGNSSAVDGNLLASLDGGVVSSDFSASLGIGFLPVSWQATATASLEDCGLIAEFTDPAAGCFAGATADVSARGNMTAFSVSGSAGVRSYVSDSLSIDGGGFIGSFTSRPSGIRLSGDILLDRLSLAGADTVDLSGVSAAVDLRTVLNGYEATCSLMVARASYGEILSDSISFDGSVQAGKDISGNGILRADSVFIAGSHYSLMAGLMAEPGSISLDSLRITGPGDLDLCLSGHLDHDKGSYGFSLDGIALTRAEKLRLISSGDVELVSDSSGIVLDTLWFDLPSGDITATGWFRNDSMDVSAVLDNVDIASFTSMAGLSVPLSGVLAADLALSGTMGNLTSDLKLVIDNPTYDEWDQSDSLTFHAGSSGDSLIIHGLWSWSDGIRSGLRMGLDGIWDDQGVLDVTPGDVKWLEAELTGVGDELFYLLPMPLKTNGASVSARIEYQRDNALISAGIASHFDRLYLTDPGIEFPGISVYLTYPHQDETGEFNGRLSITSANGLGTTLESTVLFSVIEDLSFAPGTLPVQLRSYRFRADFNQWQTLIAGVGWLQFSGSLFSESNRVQEKPRIVGKLTIDQATISMGGGGAIEGSAGGQSSRPAEMPLELSIRISGDRGIWFRNNYANVELSTSIDITTVQGQLRIGGDIKAVRGGVYLLGREFQITQGEVRILETTPLGIELDVLAEARIRSSVSGTEYIIQVSVTGDPENPEISLSATGPSGALAEQDIVTLLTAGMTYGELQQFDSTALGSVAGTYLGQWLARSIRDDVGLDALQFTPDFSSDSTSLVVNAGKYVLPDLFVSYSSDVFSSDAGTIRAQYFINRDFFLEGSTKSTLTGRHDPSIELHYTYRY